MGAYTEPDTDDVITTEVTGVGNGAHITIPKKYLGRRVKILVLPLEPHDRPR